MLKIYLLWPGKTKERWLQDGLDFYLKKLRNYYQVKLLPTKAAKGPMKRKKELMDREAQFLNRALPKNSYKIALDLNGRNLSSREFASFLKEREELGDRDIAFVIGGAFGLAKRLLDECNFSLCLSRMTFTHEMSRLILLEQLYRAATINTGSPYHH